MVWGASSSGPGSGGLPGQLRWDPLEGVGGGLVAPRLPSSPLNISASQLRDLGLC